MIRVVQGRVLSWSTVSHHRFDVTYRLPARPLHALAPSFTMSVVASAGSNTEVLLTTDTDLRSADTFYTHNGWQFLRRVRHSGPRPAHFYPAVAAFRLQDEDSSGAQPVRRLTLVTSHTCAASAPAAGRIELLIHRHLSQDDGRGLAEGVADGSRQDLTLTFSLQSIDRLQPSLRTSSVHFDDERSLNEQLLRVQHPPLPFFLARAAQAQPPAGYAEFSAVGAETHSLFAHLDDWHAHQLSSVSPLQRSFPPNVHLHSLMARDAVSDDVALRLQHLGVDVTQESDRAELAEEDRQLAAKVSLDLTALFSPATRLTELRRVGLTLNHRWPFSGRRRHRHTRSEEGGDAVEDADSLHPGWLFRADASEAVLDTLLLRPFLSQRSSGAKAGGANQNSQEEGVFISEAAIRAELEKKNKQALEEEQQRTQGGAGAGGARHRRRALLALEEAEQGSLSSLSLPLLHLEPYQLQSFLLHYQAVDEQQSSGDGVDAHSKASQQPRSSPRANAQPQQPLARAHSTPRSAQHSSPTPAAHSPASLHTTALPAQPPRADAHGEKAAGDDDAEGAAMGSDSPPFLHPSDGEGPSSSSLLATIPSRVEYLAILLVCLAAVCFFALALGLLPSKQVRRAALQLTGSSAGGGSVNGAHGAASTGGGGAGGGGGGVWSQRSLAHRANAALFAFEHSASTAWHRLRALMLNARYGRPGQRMGGGGGGGGGTTAA